jgi:hypothetical protein
MKRVLCNLLLLIIFFSSLKAQTQLNASDMLKKYHQVEAKKSKKFWIYSFKGDKVDKENDLYGKEIILEVESYQRCNIGAGHISDVDFYIEEKKDKKRVFQFLPCNSARNTNYDKQGQASKLNFYEGVDKPRLRLFVLENKLIATNIPFEGDITYVFLPQKQKDFPANYTESLKEEWLNTLMKSEYMNWYKRKVQSFSAEIIEGTPPEISPENAKILNWITDIQFMKEKFLDFERERNSNQIQVQNIPMLMISLSGENKTHFWTNGSITFSNENTPMYSSGLVEQVQLKVNLSEEQISTIEKSAAETKGAYISFQNVYSKEKGFIIDLFQHGEDPEIEIYKNAGIENLNNCAASQVYGILYINEEFIIYRDRTKNFIFIPRNKKTNTNIDVDKLLKDFSQIDKDFRQTYKGSNSKNFPYKLNNACEKLHNRIALRNKTRKDKANEGTIDKEKTLIARYKNVKKIEMDEGRTRVYDDEYYNSTIEVFLGKTTGRVYVKIFNKSKSRINEFWMTPIEIKYKNTPRSLAQRKQQIQADGFIDEFELSHFGESKYIGEVGSIFKNKDGKWFYQRGLGQPLYEVITSNEESKLGYYTKDKKLISKYFSEKNNKIYGLNFGEKTLLLESSTEDTSQFSIPASMLRLLIYHLFIVETL